MSRDKENRAANKTAPIWDAKGPDVPKGRVIRSLQQGTTRMSKSEQTDAIRKRRSALDRLRAHARNLEPADREPLWKLVTVIGRNGFPSWAEVVAARTEIDFLSLAQRGEMHIEKNARRDRSAQNSERRTCVHSVDEYLAYREAKEFSPSGDAAVKSVLRRMLAVDDSEGVPYRDRRLATLGFIDAERINNELAFSNRLPEGQDRVESGTQEKNTRILSAWLNWELKKEAMRARDAARPPVFSTNIFEAPDAGFSEPIRARHMPLSVKEQSRRFFPEEIASIQKHGTIVVQHAVPILHRLGLRPGEFMHLRYGIDVVALDDGAGYEVRLEGGRGRDPRCGCPACRTKKGWAPKNGPRRYVLSRAFDEIGWITPAIDAIDSWVEIRKPALGDFLFASPHSRERAMTNAQLNELIHTAAQSAGVVSGLRSDGRRTAHSLRHACASEMLELGIPHPLAASWIGDTLKTFMETYGRPDPAQVARVTLAMHVHREVR